MQLQILVGTVTQTAYQVAQAISLVCADLVPDVNISQMEALDLSVFDAAKTEAVLYLICISTHGVGDVPENARALYDGLDTQPQYLGHVSYGVVALGDSSSYPETFCFGGKKFDARLQDLGARRRGEICCLDAGSGIPPEPQAAQWSLQWLADALAAIPARSLLTRHHG